MTITAKNIGRINVWPTYAIAREADTEECKFTGQLTVWPTYQEARANISHEEEGGGGVPDWVPANAVIHIDLVGGSPQGRAWANGAEVAVDTLLGTDANTESAWAASGYEPEGLMADGLVYSLTPPALIGSARTMALAGATVRMQVKEGAGAGTFYLLYLSVPGNTAVQFELNVALKARGSSWDGSYSQSIDDIVNTGTGAVNVLALTATPTRAEFAANGSAPTEGYELTTDDWPVEGEDALVAVLVDPSALALQSITLYDPLPSTAGLSELSEVA